MEMWRGVFGYEEYYEVSNIGRMKRLERVINTIDNKTYTIKEKILALGETKKGYFQITFTVNKVSKRFYAHRVVFEAFVKQIPNDLEINHKDLNKQNNCISNLELVTRSENCIHSYYNQDYDAKFDCREVVGYHKETGEKQEFKSMSCVIRWLRNNGYPKAFHGNIASCCNYRYSYAYDHIWNYKENT